MPVIISSCPAAGPTVGLSGPHAPPRLDHRITRQRPTDAAGGGSPRSTPAPGVGREDRRAMINDSDDSDDATAATVVGALVDKVAR